MESKENKKSKLDNGYPFRDDIINFKIKYKGKKHYFEFPVLMDKSFLLREIKSRTGVRGAFCLRWQENDDKTEDEQEKPLLKTSEKPARLADYHKELKGEEICIHSSCLTTLFLTRFCGHTLRIVEGDGKIPGGDASWYHYSQDPVLEYKRKLIEQRLRPFDCPP